MTTISNNRRIDIDLAKGIGIILVVVGHSSLPLWLRNSIYIFHMPLFFMLSGLLYKSSSCTLREYVVKKAKSLLYPYFVLGVLIVFYNTLFDFLKHSFDIFKLGKRVIALAYGGYIWENNYDYIGVLWFLVALFVVEVVFEIVFRKFKMRKVVITSIAVICVAGFVLSYLINASRALTANGAGLRLPFCVDIALIGYVFFAVGYLVQNIRIKPLWGCISLFAGLIIGWINIYLSGYGTDMLYLRWGIPALYLIAAVLSSYGVFEICRFVSNKVKNGISIKFLTSCGKLSLLIMVTHLYLVPYCHKALSVLHVNYEPLKVVLVFVVSYILSIFISKKMQWLYKLK